MKTEWGRFVQDDSGLYHYEPVKGSIIFNAAADALAHKPEGPAWFWFNDIPSPILKGDDKVALLNRWDDWRNAASSGKIWESLKTIYESAIRTK